MTGTRAAYKVAYKNAIRNPSRTVFLALLVSAPVAFGVVVAGVIRASTPSLEEQTQAKFGAADVSVEVLAAPPEAVTWVESTLDQLVPEITLTEFHRARIRLPEAGYAEVLDIDLTDPLAQGLLLLLEGRAPQKTGEVSITPALAERLEVEIGDVVHLEQLPPGDLVVVGYVTRPLDKTGVGILVEPGGLTPLIADPEDPAITTLLLVDPGAGEAAQALLDLWSGEGETRFLPEPSVEPVPPELASLEARTYHLLTESQVQELVELARSMGGPSEYASAFVSTAAFQMVWGGNAHRRLPEVRVESRSQWLDQNYIGENPAIVSTTATSLILVEVAFVTGAAFAAGIRRRLREIGLLGSNGADEGHIRATVVGEGLTIGSIGSLTGVGLGIGVLMLGRPLLQRFVYRVDGFELALTDVLGPVLVAMTSVLLAVSIPARTASQVTPITALQGRMPTSAPKRWVVPFGGACAGAGLLLLTVSLASNAGSAGFMVGVGVVLMAGGVAMLAGPILAAASKLADHVPATGRLILRDAGRHRTRAAVAVAAIMVILLIPVMVITVDATTVEKNLIHGLPSPSNHLVLRGSYAGLSYGGVNPITDSEVAAVTAIVPERRVAVFNTLNLRALTNEIALAQGSGVDGITPTSFNDGFPVAIADDDLLHALDDDGVTESIGDGKVAVLGLEEKETRVFLNEVEYPGREHPVAVLQQSMPRILIPQSMAPRFAGTESRPLALIVLERSLSDQESRQVWNLGLAFSGGDRGLSDSETYLLVIALSLMVVLVVVALVTAVSAAEVDEELRTMVAIGAAGSFRRRFLGLLTGYQALVAMTLAVPLGLSLAWAFISSQNWFYAGPFGVVDASAVYVPWGRVALFAVSLPPLIGLLTLVSVRSAPVTPPRRAT